MKIRPGPIIIFIVSWVMSGAMSLAAPFGVLGGVGLVGHVPLSGDLSETYSVGPGIGLDLHLVYSPHFRLDFGLAPAWVPGSPTPGALATNESASLLYLPVYANFQYTLASSKSFQPYAGAGLGFTYVREKLSFTSGIGDKEASQSATVLGWQAVVGIEQAKKGRLFLEAWLLGGGTGGVEGVEDSGTSMMSLQLRLGYRVTLR